MEVIFLPKLKYMTVVPLVLRYHSSVGNILIKLETHTMQKYSEFVRFAREAIICIHLLFIGLAQKILEVATPRNFNPPNESLLYSCYYLTPPELYKINIRILHSCQITSELCSSENKTAQQKFRRGGKTFAIRVNCMR